MDKHVKIVFSLEKDEDGYPPVDYEGLWAIPLSNGNFLIDNIPFYARGVSAEDEVEAVNIDGELRFKFLKVPSRNSTFRLIVFDPPENARIRADLESLGCKSEYNQHIGLIAVEIPGDVEIDRFLRYVLDAREREVLDFEEGALRHKLA